MRRPPLVPQGFDFRTYIVLDDFGKLGRAYREVGEEQADKASVAPRTRQSAAREATARLKGELMALRTRPWWKRLVG